MGKLTDYQTLLDHCNKPFRYYELQKNFKGHLYASVQATQARLNDLGVPWNLTHNSLVVERYQWVNAKGKEVTNYDAYCSVQLEIESLGSRCGTGADTNQDPDTATKSALAYALRKAGNQFGIAWYITNKPAEEVALWEFLSGADLTDLTTVKKAVKMVADIDGIAPKTWLQSRGIEGDDFNSPAMLQHVLIEAGRI